MLALMLRRSSLNDGVRPRPRPAPAPTQARPRHDPAPPPPRPRPAPAPAPSVPPPADVAAAAMLRGAAAGRLRGRFGGGSGSVRGRVVVGPVSGRGRVGGGGVPVVGAYICNRLDVYNCICGVYICNPMFTDVNCWGVRQHLPPLSITGVFPPCLPYGGRCACRNVLYGFPVFSVAPAPAPAPPPPPPRRSPRPPTWRRPLRCGGLRRVGFGVGSGSVSGARSFWYAPPRPCPPPAPPKGGIPPPAPPQGGGEIQPSWPLIGPF